MRVGLKGFVRGPGGLGLVTALAWFAACSTDPGGPCPECGTGLPTGLIVSNPVPSPSLTAGAKSTAAFASSAGSAVTYVSLAPGTVPAGAIAVVRRLGDAASLTAGLAHGGFDPVPVTANVGDSIAVTVNDAGGATRFQARVAVIGDRPPVIVRTDPLPRKRDVPLNPSIMVIFSEPIDGATLMPGSIRLLRGGTAVPGTARFLDASLDAAQVRVAFVPDNPLAVSADYQFIVSQSIRDRSGQPLATADTVPFTTGTTSTSPPASIRISVDSGTVFVTGTTFQLAATVLDAAGNELTDQPVTWSTTTPTVLTISPTGLLIAVGDGDGLIGTSVGGVSIQTHLVVTALPPAAVSLAPTSASVGAGDTVILAATVRDAQGREINHPSLTWSSSDPAVANVATTGPDPRIATVTAVQPGSVTVTASSGTRSATGTISIGPQVPVASVTVIPPAASVVLQGTVQLAAILRSANGKVLFTRPTTWSSANTALAVVDASGLVTGTGAGTALITATREGVSGTSAITVTSVAFASLIAGGGNTCGLTNGGAAYCWGFNQSGQVGDGSTMNRLFPVAVAGGLSFTALGLGYYHVCGVARGGAMYCWGYNYFGQLGDGTTIDRSVPVAVVGGLTFTAVTANNVWSCGLTTGGEAYCWGGSSLPVLVAGGHTFAEVSAGNSHACGLTASGAAYCWGDGTYGQLGDGSFVGSGVPVPVTGGLSFTTLSANGGHTCGLTASGAVYCWGDNSAGQLGDGSGSNSAIPVLVTGGLSFTTVSAGTNHTCGLTALGQAYCWGRNDEGELGNATLVSSPTPVLVSGGLLFNALTASQHTCGLTVTGVAFCWGDNTFGQIGDGSTTNRFLPVKVAGQP